MVGSAEGISAILLQFFFAAIGAAGSVAQVVSKAPALFAFSFLQIAIHLGFIFLVGKLLRVDKKDLIIGSNANVGGEQPYFGETLKRPSCWLSFLNHALDHRQC